MSDKTPRERAIDKINLELAKDIQRIIEIARTCGLGELQYFLHYMHFMRVTLSTQPIPDDERRAVEMEVRQAEETFKYLIQVLMKYGVKTPIENGDGIDIDRIKVLALSELVGGMNSKHEMRSFVTLFSDVELIGERDQELKIDMNQVMEDERLKKFFLYSARVDKDNDIQKEDLKTHDEYLDHFKQEYMPFSDLLEAEFGIDVEKLVQVMDYILKTVVEQMHNREDDFTYFDNGKLDIQDYNTIKLFSSALVIARTVLIEKFGEEIEPVLDRLTFKPESFDENELNYNLIAREPLLNIDGDFHVSPEILLDSLFVNWHYSLLESGGVADKYKARYAETFVDKISSIASDCGYSEVTRELELYEGKNQIGDLDLVLKNDDNHFILVEAKNHTIPINVYFHDFKATEKRLEYLQSNWEAKVKRRFDHVTTKHQDYGISATFTYIIVSKFPEILSHFSNFLVFSLQEFEYWLSKGNLELTFEEVHSQYYRLDEEGLTEEQLIELQEGLNTGWRFEKE